MKFIYRVLLFKRGLIYARLSFNAEEFSPSTYIREILAHGYGIDIRLEEA